MSAGTRRTVLAALALVVNLVGVADVTAHPPAPDPSVDATVGPLVSGRGSYTDGTYAWTDYAYDDRGPDEDGNPGGDAAYPEGMQPDNVADLIQIQVRRVGAETEVAVVLQTLTPSTRPVVAVAFDRDGRTETGAPALPGSWVPASPLGMEELFVLSATGGRHQRWSTAGWTGAGAFDVAVDAEANTLRARVPFALPATGMLRVVAAAGHADDAGRSWLDGASPVHDLAFVVGEDPVTPYLQGVTDAVRGFAAGGGASWQDRRQSAILAGAEDPAGAFGAIDVTALRTGRTSHPNLDTGFHTFLYRSALRLGEGIQGEGNAALYAGPFQPYLVRLPRAPRPGLPLVLYLHGASQTHLSAVNVAHYDERSRDPVLGLPEHIFDLDAVVAWPFGRGPTQWWEGPGERDALDVADDVLDRLALDRERVMLAGLSMGGYGTFRLGQLYPDRWSVAYADVGADRTGLAENMTALPVRFQNGAADYLVHVNRAVATRQALDEAGTVDYRSWIIHEGHHQPAVRLAECVYHESFTKTRVRNPARVRYAVDPAMVVDDAERGLELRYAGAYWVSGMRPAGAGRASVDLTTGAFGRVPVPGPTTNAIRENVSAGRDFCGPNPDARTRNTWDEQARAVTVESRPAEPVVRGVLRQLAAVTIAADRAGIPTGRLELDSDAPLELTLTGLRAGTLVDGGVRRAVAGASGRATVTLPAGKVTLRLTRP